jgi:6-phosphogluconate dehydrogenase
MELAMIGLGRMGLNMARRLMRGGHSVHASDRSPDNIAQAVAAGAVALTSLAEVTRLAPPRVVWVMVPSGPPTGEVIESLAALLSPGDIVIDGGNSNYKDSIARQGKLAEKGIRFLDAGTSGGIWGLENGYCLMVGGPRDAYAHVEPILRSLAPPDGCELVGGPGAGHYAKMVHNGIEYGMMQAYAEGFELLRASGHGFDLRRLAQLWNRGSVVRSWLLELAERAFERDPDLSALRGYVEDSGEGRWTVFEAIEHNVPAPAITLALLTRLRSRQEDSFQAKVLAALRNEFGGHAVKTTERS